MNIDIDSLSSRILTSVIVIVFVLISFLLVSSTNVPAFSGVYFDSKPLKAQSTQNTITRTNQNIVSKSETLSKEAETEIILQERIARVENFFTNYGAVISGYGDIIVRQAHACGGDYRILIGIAGNESGLGRIPYKKYNPFGYLDGVQYSSWEEALTYLSCKISQQHLVPCNNNLECVIRRYGGPDTPVEKWLQNVTWFMQQV